MRVAFPAADLLGCSKAPEPMMCRPCLSDFDADSFGIDPECTTPYCANAEDNTGKLLEIPLGVTRA